MTRHPFGWDLPPGCTLRHIEEAMGTEEPCQCCGMDPADCICPECPHCGEQGNPKCYGQDGTAHGLIYNRDQLMGQSRMRIAMLKEQIQDEEQYLAHMEQGGNIDD
jgi:hypothetical protein